MRGMLQNRPRSVSMCNPQDMLKPYRHPQERHPKHLASHQSRTSRIGNSCHCHRLRRRCLASWLCSLYCLSRRSSCAGCCCRALGQHAVAPLVTPAARERSSRSDTGCQQIKSGKYAHVRQAHQSRLRLLYRMLAVECVFTLRTVTHTRHAGRCCRAAAHATHSS